MAAGATYEPIATYTASGSPTTYTFSSIPATYTDLILIGNLGTADTSTNIQIRVNSDTASNYSQTELSGNGTTAASRRQTSVTNFQLDYTAYPDNNFNFNFIVQLMNYANTTTYKTFIKRVNNSTWGTDAGVGLWRSTSAINSITIFATAGRSFNTGSTLTLYGIAAA
jgi:hypothetical protein